MRLILFIGFIWYIFLLFISSEFTLFAFISSLIIIKVFLNKMDYGMAILSHLIFILSMISIFGHFLVIYL